MHALKSIVTLVVVAGVLPLASLVGCEGEPPMVPQNATEPGPSSASAVASATAAAAPEAPAPSTTVCPPPPCASPVASASAPPATSGAPSEAAALPVPPATVARGNLVGSVTTVPAALMGQAVVYLEDGPKEDQPSLLQSATIANRQMAFVPFVSVVAEGGKVVFVNDDPFPHNVFSPDGDKFNMGNIPQHGAHQRVFHTPGAFALLCNLHPGMIGYLLVTPSTWWAKTDAKGKFVMKHVPNGSYKVTAWAPRQAPITQPVTIADGDVTLHFELHR